MSAARGGRSGAATAAFRKAPDPSAALEWRCAARGAASRPEGGCGLALSAGLGLAHGQLEGQRDVVVVRGVQVGPPEHVHHVHVRAAVGDACAAGRLQSQHGRVRWSGAALDAEPAATTRACGRRRSLQGERGAGLHGTRGWRGSAACAGVARRAVLECAAAQERSEGQDC